MALNAEELEAHKARKRRNAEDFQRARPATGNSTVFVCQLCAGERLATTDRAAMIAHLAAEHGVDEAAIRTARGRMLAHIDGDTFFQDDHAFTLGDGREFLLRSVRTARTPRTRLF